MLKKRNRTNRENENALSFHFWVFGIYHDIQFQYVDKLNKLNNTKYMHETTTKQSEK